MTCLTISALLQDTQFFNAFADDEFCWFFLGRRARFTPKDGWRHTQSSALWVSPPEPSQPRAGASPLSWWMLLAALTADFMAVSIQA